VSGGARLGYLSRSGTRGRSFPVSFLWECAASVQLSPCALSPVTQRGWDAGEAGGIGLPGVHEGPRECARRHASRGPRKRRDVADLSGHQRLRTTPRRLHQQPCRWQVAQRATRLLAACRT
jgi:hypothetical protein